MKKHRIFLVSIINKIFGDTKTNKKKLTTPVQHSFIIRSFKK